MRINKAALFEDLGYTPHAGQQAIHEAHERVRVVACGVRFGKTTCAAMEGLAAAMAPAPQGSIGWIAAPTYDLADRVFREMRLRAEEHLKPYLVSASETERRLILTNLAGGRSEVRAKSADNPVSLLGEGLDWVIVDEASRLKPGIWEGHLSQRLIDKKGWALLISTPKGKGWFYGLFRRGRGPSKDPDVISFNMPSWTNPLLDRAVIEAERARIPERSFLQEYEAMFLEGQGSVFRNVRTYATGEWIGPTQGATYWAGLDLAKTTDWTVLVILDAQRRVVFVDRYRRLDWSLQVARIQAALERYNDALVYVDSTGAGEPVLESIRHAGVSARAYGFTNRSKAALVDNLSLMLERGKITLPRLELWPEGIEELEAFEYSVSETTGTVRTSAPYGTHDDCVIGLALAAWGARHDESKEGCVTSFTRQSGVLGMSYRL